MGDFTSSFSFKKTRHHLFHRPDGGYHVLDGMRAIALLAVILVHVVSVAPRVVGGEEHGWEYLANQVNQTPWYFEWIWNVDMMVDLFFMLSGFLIAGLLFHEIDKTDGIRLRTFYYRRFMRLMPVYVVFALLYYAAGLPNHENIWQNLLYINNFFPHEETAAPWTWSLAVEEQFYLIFPIFVLFVLHKSRFALSWLVAWFGFSCLVRLYTVLNDDILLNHQLYDQWEIEGIQDHYFTVIYDNLYTRFGAFICGIAAQHLYHYRREETKNFFLHNPMGKLFILLNIGIVILTLGLNLAKSSIELPQWAIVCVYVFKRNLFSFAVAALMLGMILKAPSLSLARALFAAKIWYPLAQLTYSAYLLHFAFVFLMLGVVGSTCAVNEWDCQYNDYRLLFLVWFLASVFTYLFAAMFFFLVERPFISYRNLKSKSSNLKQQIADTNTNPKGSVETT